MAYRQALQSFKGGRRPSDLSDQTVWPQSRFCKVFERGLAGRDAVWLKSHQDKVPGIVEPTHNDFAFAAHSRADTDCTH